MLVADPQGQQNVLIKSISYEDVGTGWGMHNQTHEKYDHFKWDFSNEECDKTCNENNAQNTVESASKQVMGRAVVPKVVAKLVLSAHQIPLQHLKYGT